MDKSLMGTFALALLMGSVLGVLACCIRNIMFILDLSLKFKLGFTWELLATSDLQLTPSSYSRFSIFTEEKWI